MTDEQLEGRFEGYFSEVVVGQLLVPVQGHDSPMSEQLLSATVRNVFGRDWAGASGADVTLSKAVVMWKRLACWWDLTMVAFVTQGVVTTSTLNVITLQTCPSTGSCW